MAAGVGSEALLLLPSHLGKWGIQNRRVSLPAMATIGTMSLDVEVFCYVRKVVWCKGRTSTSEALQCDVKKEARFKSVTFIVSPGIEITTLCSSAGGEQPYVGHPEVCVNPAPGNLKLFANISTPSDACSAMVKLL